MDWDEPVNKASKTIAVGEDLSNLGVAELAVRIEALKAEIGRVEAELGKKKAQAEAASKLFG